MIAICPHCRQRIAFSLKRTDALQLQCPLCHSFVFGRLKALETLFIVAELGAFGLAVVKSLISGYMILVAAIGLVALAFAFRISLVLFHNMRNKNIY